MKSAITITVYADPKSGPASVLFGRVRPTIEAIEHLMVAAGIPTEGPRPPVIDIYARPQGR